jgi:selenide,water dikinase
MTHVLLLGGGHTHLGAAPRLGRLLAGRARVTLLAPEPLLLYSGMMPGWLARQYAFDDCAIDLRRVATAAGVEWCAGTVVDIDFAARAAITADGRRHPYDLLSLNVGSANHVGDLAPDASITVLAAKPFAAFVDGWTRWLRSPPPAPRCVVVGGGAAAVEIACALESLTRDGRALAGGSVALATSGDRLLAGHSPLAVRLARRTFERRRIALLTGRRYTGVRAGAVQLQPTAGGLPQALPADLLVVATGALPPQWLARAARAQGLAVAADGGIAVHPTMQSVGDERVFASGDCATFVDRPVPKSGVHALKQGEPLARSIVARLDGAPGTPYVAQRQALALLNRCDGTAIASYGVLAAAGAVWWRWKDRIDRRFVERFR